MLLAAAPLPGAAHDTWLSLHGTPQRGVISLSLSTGQMFPLAESGHSRGGVAYSGCVTASRQALALQARDELATALLLRTRADLGKQPLACWVATRAQGVQLTPAEVQTYLHEIRAPEAIRTRWRGLHAQGLPWDERFSKVARIEHAGPAREGLAALRTATGNGVEILPVGDQSARIGQPLTLQVLDNGTPLAGQPVQLRSERNPLGIWRVTDAAGQAQFSFPFGGRWMVRTVRLLPPALDGKPWESRFSTLVVEPS